MLRTYKFGLTCNKGSIQHFTYKQWKEINQIKKESICISVVTHPQHRIVSSYYFLGYNKHYSFLDFLKKIKDGSLLSSIRFSPFRAIIKQHIIPISDYLTNDNGKIDINFILKTESLDSDWKKLCELYKLSYSPLKHLNKTKPIKDWKELYRNYPETEALVYKLYKNDFRNFNYKYINS